MKRWIPTLALAGLLAAGPALADPAEDLQATRDAAVAKLLSDLAELAAYAQENELLAGRDACFELVLVFDPENAEARKTLHYVKKGDEWVKRSDRRPGDRNDELAPLFYPRLKETVRTFTQTLLDAICAAFDELRFQDRTRFLADVLAVDPDHAEARKLNGEAPRKGGWVLIESELADQRRQKLKGFVKDAYAALPEPKPVEPTDDERALGVSWKHGVQGEWWRGLGTTGKGEVEKTLASMEVSDEVFRHTFGVETPAMGNCGFYLLTGKSQAKEVLEKHPSFGKDKAAYALGLSAVWIPGRPVFFHYADTPEVRRDGSTRMAIGMLLMRVFGINTDCGWIWEGLGLYLDELITGSRRTVFVTREIVTATNRDERFDIERRMKDPTSNWLSLAKELFHSGVAPDLRTMSRHTVNELGASELLVAYSICRYLVEGRPEEATRFFASAGGRTMDGPVEMVFGMPLEIFEQRLIRWLEEVT